MNEGKELKEVLHGLKKAVSSKQSKGIKYEIDKLYDETGMQEEMYPGFNVAKTHKLAPKNMMLNISSRSNDNSLTKYFEESKYKYIFDYIYLDLGFTISTDDDNIASQLYPFFSEEQKTQIAAMTLGSHQKEKQIIDEQVQQVADIEPLDGRNF